MDMESQKDTKGGERKKATEWKDRITLYVNFFQKDT